MATFEEFMIELHKELPVLDAYRDRWNAKYGKFTKTMRGAFDRCARLSTPLTPSAATTMPIVALFFIRDMERLALLAPDDVMITYARATSGLLSGKEAGQSPDGLVQLLLNARYPTKVSTAAMTELVAALGYDPSSSGGAQSTSLLARLVGGMSNLAQRAISSRAGEIDALIGGRSPDEAAGLLRRYWKTMRHG